MSTRELTAPAPKEVMDLRQGKTKFTPDEAFRILEYQMPGVEKCEPTGIGAQLAAELQADGLAPGRRRTRRSRR